MGKKKESKISWFMIIVYALAVAALLIPFPALVVEIFYGIELVASLIILIYVCQNKYKSLPRKILFFTLYSMAVNIKLTSNLLIGIQNDNQLPLVSFLAHYWCHDSFIVGIIFISLILGVTFFLAIKGVRRLSGVSAKFALDTLNPKLFNIDNKYSNHEITEEEAETMKKNLHCEMDFFASMDGAARFFAGNTKAMLLMTSIDITGGIAIGYFMQGKSLLEAIKPAILFTTGNVVLYCVPLIIISIPSVFCVTKKVLEH
jgi:flagellar biosynthesis protein FlhA